MKGLRIPNSTSIRKKKKKIEDLILPNSTFTKSSLMKMVILFRIEGWGLLG